MKNYNKHLSFLNTSERHFKFTKIGSYPFLELFKNSIEMVLTQQFIKAHREQLQIVMFQFEVEDQYKKWRIIKQFRDFIELKEQLHIRFREKLLDVPITDASQIKDNMHEQLLSFFQLFLNTLVTQTDVVEQKVFKHFVGNHLSHENKQIKVYYQGYLCKRNWGRHNQSGFKKMFNFLASWEKKYFTITKEGVYFTDYEASYEIQDNLIFSTTFSFSCGEASAGYQYGILINSSHRALQLDAEDIFTFGLFAHFLSQAISENKNIRQNRFISFARVRSGCESEYFVDGQDYFSSLCDSLLSAKKQIFITGWMISPYFSLKRPDDQQEYRFDVILAKIAKAGIKINIIIYNAPKLALTIDSEFTQKYLTSLSPNIRVQMHPNYMLIPFMWSHHEKMVIIDQAIAYMGGLDIGYGRLDSKLHQLTDTEGQFWPGADYCNYRVADISSPIDYRTSSIDRKKVPRMPWHDIGVKLMGNSVQDLCRHFIQYWNHVNFQLSMNDRELLMYAGISTIEIENHKNSPEKQKPNSKEKDKIKEKEKLKEEEDPNEKQQKFTSHRKALRSQSHEENNFEPDFDFLKFGDEPIKKNRTQELALSLESSTQSYSSSSYQLQRNSVAINQEQIEFYTAHLQDVSKIQQFFTKLNPKNIINHRYGTSFENVTLNQNTEYHPKGQIILEQTHQIVRSESMWSIGLEESETEQSVLNAYIDLICNAQQFIYIENQFFISQENRVIKCLINKIVEAYKQKKKFRVIVLLPALPGFQGHPADEKSAVFRVQVHLVLKTINYMYRKLRRIPNIDHYLAFFSLRTHGVLDNRPVTEIIYIHSKLLIVDDRIALIGSANINDRSLLGSRDTELAVIIENDLKEEVKAGDKVRLVSKFAHSLRKDLYMEHFGLSDSESVDYFNDDIWYSMIEVSKKNHYIYREIFGCYPDDEMTHFYKIYQMQKEANPSKYELLAPLIKGQSIPYQRSFLCQEDLSLRPSQKEYFVPSISFN